MRPESTVELKTSVSAPILKPASSSVVFASPSAMFVTSGTVARSPFPPREKAAMPTITAMMATTITPITIFFLLSFCGGCCGLPERKFVVAPAPIVFVPIGFGITAVPSIGGMPAPST